MDKQTLSNYGLLTVVTLILAVMLAFATPFGTYVGDGVVSVANGFVGTSSDTLNNENINNIEDKWENKFNDKPNADNENIELCKHNSLSEEIIVQANCKQEGTIKYTCECGYTYTEQVSKSEHGELTTVNQKNATCTTEGYTGDKVCSVCEEVVTRGETIGVLGHTEVNGGVKDSHIKCSKCSLVLSTNHTYSKSTITAATCTTKGTTKYICSCGYSYTAQDIPTVAHTYTKKDTSSTYLKTNATCTSPAVYYYRCTGCTSKGTNTYTSGSTASHTYTSKVTTNATCTTTGVRTYTCNCGDSYTETVPANGHEFVSIPAVEPTCTTNGSGEGRYCSTCNRRWEGVTIVATGHQHTELQGVIEATCYQQGYTGDTLCTDCGIVVEIGTIIAKTDNHINTVISGAFDATCTTKGYTGDTICKDCGEIVEYGIEIATLGHIDENSDSKCDRCNANLIPAGGEYKQGDNTYTGGEEFPETTQADDTYTYGNYTYTYFNAYMGHTTNKGWKVKCNVNIADPGPMLESVNGLPVTSLLSTFSDCTNLTVIPEIPSTVKIMVDTYKGCTSITTPPELPSYLSWSSGMFEDCTNLTTAPILPNGYDFADMFSGCTSLKTYVGSTDPDGDFSNYIIPEFTSYIFIDGMFKECEKMVLPPVIPDYATNLESMFSGCKSLTTAPTLPSNVVVINSLFSNCTSLKTYVGSKDAVGDFTNYVIPSTVAATSNVGYKDRVYSTFYNCDTMVKAPKMSQCTSIKELERVFYSCANLTTVPDLPINVEILDATFEYSSKLKYIPEDLSVYTKLTNMKEAFYDTAITKVTALPSGVQNLNSTFMGCDYLTHAPVIPDSATDISYFLYGCKSLKTYTGNVNGDYNFENYHIPSNITSIHGLMYRAPIVVAPTIDENIKDISYAFDMCSSLNYITINGNPTTYTQCFRGAPVIEIYGTCTIKDTLMAIAKK